MTSTLEGYAYVWHGSATNDRTLLLLHGTGADEHDLVPLGRALAPDANLLSPRGNVLENGMPRFFRRHAAGVLDIDDLRARAVDLARFVARAAEVHAFDPTRVTALGFSNGANAAAGMLLERPRALRAAILVRAMNAYSPAATPDLDGVRVLLLAGRRDPYSQPAATEPLAATLRDGGANVDVHYADAGHEMTAADVETARAWMKRDE